MNKNRFTIVAFLLLAAGLVIGQRFGFRSAGGTGYEAPRYGVVRDMTGTGSVDRNGTLRPLTTKDKLMRGEIVRTGDTGYALIAFEDRLLALAKRTDVEIVENDAHGFVLDVRRGRIIFDDNADQDAEVRVGTTRVNIYRLETLSLVHYDFQGLATASADGGNWDVSNTAGEKVSFLQPGEAVSFSTNGPLNLAENANITGAEVPFYDWLHTHVPYLP